MPIAHQFDYEKPASLADAIGLLAEHGASARVLAGGTDLIGWIREDVLAPRLLVDIKGIHGLKEISFDGKTLSIGSLATFNELIESPIVRRDFPLLCEMAEKVASNGIRNRATMAGNICSAVPCNDSGPVLLVYEANIVAARLDGERIIPATEWFRGPRSTALQHGELLDGIEITKPPRGHGGCWVKMGRYKGEDLAQASVAVLALPDHQWRVAFGSVAPTPVRGTAIERLLAGNPLSPELIEEARKLLPGIIAPITDIRASREYRMHMVGVMLERGLQAAASRLAGKGPAYGQSVI